MKLIAVDLDGTLAEYDGWKGDDIIGDPIPGAKEFLLELGKLGKIIIHTVRVSFYTLERTHQFTMNPDDYIRNRMLAVRDWMNDNNLRFDSIWGGIGKPYADVYIDDRAVNATAYIFGVPALQEQNIFLSKVRGLLADGV